MDLSDPQARDAWFDHLRGLLSGRPVVCGVAPLAGMNDWVALLARAGARKPLLVYSVRGAGPVPTPEDAHLVEIERPRFPTITEELRTDDALLRSLPARVRDAIDAYDPGREGLWLVSPFVSADPIDERPVAGGRPRAWSALEDKIVADQMWDAVGYPRSPSRVVAISSTDELEAASAELDRGDGVVWVADARDGFNGGGEFTRWVASAPERADALAFFGPRCERVRVMPFLDGVPCSIHGIVLPDGTAVLRPVELAILRGEQRRFVYGGQGTSWDPPPEDRARMRDLARGTGELLRSTVGYRGGFGIDGVLTEDGFRPTELNPRFSAGLATLGRALDAGLFQLLQLNLVAGRDPGVEVADLEQWALPALDGRRVFRPRAVSSRRVVEESVEVGVRRDGDRLLRDDAGSWRLTVGPSATGAFAMLMVPDEEVAVGDRIGPANAAMMRFLDEELGTGFGTVEPAPDVRRSDREQGQHHHRDVRDDLPDTDLLGGQPASR